MINKLLSLFRKKQPEAELPFKPDTEFMTVWGVMDGPMENEDGEVFLLMKVSIDDSVFHTEIYLDDFDHAYELVRYFDTNMQPLQIPIVR